MSAKPKNIYAFPRPRSQTNSGIDGRVEYNSGTPGMTLRDYFAATAMMGDWSAKFNEANWLEPGSEDEVMSKSAALYYRMADAMLHVRAERVEQENTDD